MKGIVIASNSSGGGKTTVTLGLMKTLKNRGFDVQGYKVGPDYIDPAFHTHITGNPSRNLDLYLMGEKGAKASFSRGKGDLGIVEGVMGLYDGKGITSEYSTAHLAATLDLPVVLVLSPKAKSTTLCAEINGLVNFEQVNISGVILNNISESYYRLLKASIEKHCKVKVFGYLPKDERLSLKSRHLGLVQSSEVEDLDNKIEQCSRLLESYIDIDELLQCFKESGDFTDDYHLERKGIRTAIAFDEAFSFYYRENIELLQEMGEVVFFSPLKDKKIPENIDFLYIGGGYPEVFADELSKNKSMMKSIKDSLDNGLKCYAECGGLMYLTESIEGVETVGYFKGKAHMTKRLQNFGYASIEVIKENNSLPKGFKINCHEFHKSYVDLEEEGIYKLTKTMYDNSLKEWNCGYIKNNTLAAYGHVHFFSNLEFIENLVD
ncbi:cobyrinate a,c-diamide synthase [Clostridium ganghwense]|uniref:Cobyrinate a,c-diamide synthase n=1 Tax=Clostridium ganghwense TaxID=312089 RepID=A0ABT4CSX6_9CLOT|nr:cobyrinate a,c-diamide synthase [Clostridium ganghwense]MCY6372175.1 cobyrinate a,c-diamide synthase [Clostridium ganghwense]